MRIHPHARRVAPLSLAALALAACAGSDPVSPPKPNFNVVGEPAFVLMKKVGPAGTYSFDLSIGTGTLPLGNPATLTMGVWDRIWGADNPAEPAADLVVREVLPLNMRTDSAYVTPLVRTADGYLGELDNFKVVIRNTNEFTVSGVDFNHGAYVIVWNSPYTRTDKGEGCTPGYWKVPQHWDSWPAPYTPTTAFGSVFANAFPGMTLQQVAAQGGGGLKALGRHTVAALLNAASSGVNYDLTVAQVIAKFNAAYASGVYEPTKNEFAGLNERECYLN